MTNPGDAAFATHLEPHRNALSAHCYRMLGSLQDAEEATQESLVRAWQRLGELREPAAARAWLYRIATTTCLDRLKQRRVLRRVLPHLVAPAADAELPLGQSGTTHQWVEPAPDSLFEISGGDASQPDVQLSLRESISLAFITALQLLPPKQRAALLLADVLGWRPREIAGMLDTTEDSVHSLLQRARKNLDGAAPDERRPTHHDEAEALRRYVALWETGDIDGFTAMLARDAVVSMPPEIAWYTGEAAIRRFFERVRATSHERRFVAVRANGAPAVATYTRLAEEDVYQAAGITVFCMRDRLITQVTRFSTPHLFARFGLPERVSGSDA